MRGFTELKNINSINHFQNRLFNIYNDYRKDWGNKNQRKKFDIGSYASLCFERKG